jgi:hypothetical protein
LSLNTRPVGFQTDRRRHPIFKLAIITTLFNIRASIL